MSYHTFQYYTFDTDLQPELTDYQNNPEQMLRNLQSQLQSYQQLRSLSVVSTPINLNPLPIIPWVPSTKFLKLLDNFDSSILNQFPCAPCAFCGRLMYPQKCEWLPYDDNCSYPLYSPGSQTANPFPSASHLSDDNTAPPYLPNDIIVPNTNFNVEIHDEDYHYTHLMAGFVKTSDNTSLPLSINDPSLEALLFPDLFPNGKGFYNDSNDNLNTTHNETYSKYIKQRVLNIDSRFRLHHRWLAWSYLQLEKIRNHQNNQRIWRQNKADKIYSPPNAAELIKQSTYSNNLIIDESITTTLPTFIRTGETICNSSNTVTYLTTEPPTSRQKAIRPISLISEEDDDPYWKNHIEKYFDRPEEEEFINLTYPDYFKNYEITPTKPTTTKRSIYVDKLGNYVIKRTVPILVRFRHLTLHHGQLFFYQKLLLEIPCKSEDELLGNFSTYREHWLFRHPEFNETLQQITQDYLRSQQLKLDSQFTQILDTLINNLQPVLPSSVSELISIQLNFLRINPPILPQSNILTLPEDQLNALSTISNILGPKNQKNKYPYFFITGSAGTGK
ncbi:unnamed protein product [Rhizophagus irregularis]|nr:unnamed protein product [Rhizophagus irregularis]